MTRIEITWKNLVQYDTTSPGVDAQVMQYLWAFLRAGTKKTRR